MMGCCRFLFHQSTKVRTSSPVAMSANSRLDPFSSFLVNLPVGLFCSGDHFFSTKINFESGVQNVFRADRCAGQAEDTFGG